MNTRNQIECLIKNNLTFINLNKSAEAKLGLSLVQYHLLSVIKEAPGASPQQIAKLANLHPSTLTQSIKRLQKKKLIYVAEDPRDSRKKIMGMTLEGNKTIYQFEKEITHILQTYK